MEPGEAISQPGGRGLNSRPRYSTKFPAPAGFLVSGCEIVLTGRHQSGINF